MGSFNDFFVDHSNGISIFLAILGILISIYSLFIVHKKRMRYVVAESNDGHILALWNSGLISIYEEDIFRLYITASKDTICKQIDCTDKDLLSNIQEVDTCYDTDGIVNWDIRFNFLIPRRGVIFKIYSEDKTSQINEMPHLIGRIRGESEKSVSCADENWFIQGGVYKKLVSIVYSSISVIISFVSVWVTVLSLVYKQDYTTLTTFIGLVGILEMVFLSFIIYQYAMPKKLREKFYSLVSKQ